MSNKILSHEDYGGGESWHVEGVRWNGTVYKSDGNSKYYCTCDQYRKYGVCVHIQTVVRELTKPVSKL